MHAQQKDPMLQQKIHTQQTSTTAGNLQADDSSLTVLKRALVAEELATAIKTELTQAEEKNQLVGGEVDQSK